jgi:phosphoglycerate dehydrogenase-like enzyme
MPAAMKSSTPIAVTSRSFSRHPILRAELSERYDNIAFNDEGRSLAGDDLVGFLTGREKAITALEKFDESILSRLPDLRVISKVGVGLDMIDLNALQKHGVLLGYAAGTNSRSVAELVIAFAIILLREVAIANRELRSGIWKQRKGGCLSGRTVGLIGCGNIGKDLVRLLKPFGCRVLCYDVLDLSKFYLEHEVTGVTLEELLSTSEIVSVHLPLNDATRRILNQERMSLMKPSAILINTSRGDLVDEDALKRMLIEGRLAAAAFDVFAAEPPEDRELINLPNFFATPHIGGSTEEAILAMGRAAIAGLDSAHSPAALGARSG